MVWPLRGRSVVAGYLHVKGQVTTVKRPHIGVLGALVLVCSALAAVALSGVRPQRASFDAAAWRTTAQVLEETNDPGCYRGGMAVDLIQTRALLGKTATEVIALLGDPESSDGLWIYWVGQCGRLWEHNALVVTFDAGARVKDAAFQ